MSSVVHFKFRNALLQDMVTFDGDHVSLADLKRLIAKKKGLIKAVDIDFAITNQETGEGLPPVLNSVMSMHHACDLERPILIAFTRVSAAEYTDPGMFIPKNTRIMVRKINAKVQSSALKDAPDKAAQ